MNNLIETICLVDGNVQRLNYHLMRMMRSIGKSCDLPDLDTLCPKHLRKGRTKCRVQYNMDGINEIQFSSYSPKQITSLKIVEVVDSFDYHLKYADRSNLNNLTFSLSPNQDVIIIKNGYVTDASYANLIFQKGDKLYTSDTPLLHGTARQYLLDKGTIEECKITEDMIMSFDKVSLINAMLYPNEVSIQINSQNIIGSSKE